MQSFTITGSHFECSLMAQWLQLERTDKKDEYFLTSSCQLSRDSSVQRKKKDGTLENIFAPVCVDYDDQKRNKRRVVVEKNSGIRYL